MTVAIFYYTWRTDLSPNGDSIKTATVLRADTGSPHLQRIFSRAPWLLIPNSGLDSLNGLSSWACWVSHGLAAG